MARPPLPPNRKQKAALSFLAGKPDHGLALSTEETIKALRASCKCAPSYRGCVQCIAATLIERMSANAKPLSERQADRLCSVLTDQIRKTVYEHTNPRT